MIDQRTSAAKGYAARADSLVVSRVCLGFAGRLRSRHHGFPPAPRPSAGVRSLSQLVRELALQQARGRSGDRRPGLRQSARDAAAGLRRGACRNTSSPQDKDWFAYKMNTEPATRAVAASLRARTGLAFEHQDVFLTNGGFAAIAVTPADGGRAGRRGDLPVAAVVLLRHADRRRGRHAVRVKLDAAALRARRGRDRGRDHGPRRAR